MDVEEGFEPAVESRAAAIVAGPIVPLAREQRARIATPSVWTPLTPPAAPRSSSRRTQAAARALAQDGTAASTRSCPASLKPTTAPSSTDNDKN
jgi:hypothetical protein